MAPEGTIEGLLHVFVEMQVGSQVLHHAEPIHLFGLFNQKPPLFGEQFTNPSQVDLVNEESVPVGIILAGLSKVPNALGPPAVLNAGVLSTQAISGTAVRPSRSIQRSA